ncbi:MAG: PAS domain S-box protein [Deltaproteobacteria bacterium]|nr:PAS domain S-box protein [Deltaproteobacteria bacterium]
MPSWNHRLDGVCDQEAPDRGEAPEAGNAAAKVESQFESVVARVAEGVVVVDASGIVRFANPAAECILGSAAGELIGTSVGQLVAEGESVETTMARKDGTMVRVEMRASRITWDGIPSVLVTLRDISELKRAERDRTFGEERLARAQRMGRLGHWEWDVKEQSLIWSDEIYRLFGFSRDTTPTFEAIVAAIHPEDRDKNRAFVGKLLGGGEQEELEFRVVLSDGTVKHVLQYAEPHLDDDGKVDIIFGTMQDVSERRLAEEVRRQNEARLEGLLRISQYEALTEQSLLDNALEEAIALTGSAIGHIYHYDDAARRLTLNSWSKGSQGQHSIADPASEYELDATGAWGEVVRQGKPVIINDFLAPDPVKSGYPQGHAALERVLTVPVRCAGRIAAVVSVANKKTDYDAADERQLTLLMDSAWKIVERRRAERALEREKAFVERLVDTAQTVILVLDPAGRIVRFNRYLEQLSGYRFEEVAGRDWFETFLPASIRPRVRELFRSAVSGVLTNGSIDPIVVKDGSERLIEWYDATLKSEDGTVTGLLSVGQDVTDRERSRREILASEQRFRLVFNNTTEGILLTDASTRKLVIGNRAFCDMVGYEPEELAGLSVTDIHPVEVLPEIGAAFQRLAAGSRAFGEAISVKRKDGSMFVADIGATAMMHEGREVLVASFRDVTETRKLRAGLAQSDRLASMGILAAGVAHEINNPLSYILYNLESLSEDIPRFTAQIARARCALASHLGEAKLREVLGADIEMLDPAIFADVQDRFRDALNGSRRIKEIARGLGTFSRVQNDEVAPVDLRYPIESAINIAFNEIKYRARIVKDFCTSVPVLASEGRLAQVFLNLLINAAHAITDGDVEHNKISIRTWQEGTDVLAEVQDTGCGVSPDVIERMFEPFFTTKPTGIGTGLGLSIVKNIITSYRGTIEATSELGKGTRIVMRFPMDRSEEELSPLRTPSDRAVGGSGGRVLVIDDEPAIRASLKRILRRHEVVEAESGEHGREILSRDPSFDVILCDMMMPRVSGVDVHLWLVQHHPQLARKVVFVTGGAFTPTAREYLENVSNVRIDKPFDPTNLQKMVAEWVAASKARG